MNWDAIGAIGELVGAADVYRTGKRWLNRLHNSELSESATAVGT